MWMKLKLNVGGKERTKNRIFQCTVRQMIYRWGKLSLKIEEKKSTKHSHTHTQQLNSKRSTCKRARSPLKVNESARERVSIERELKTLHSLYVHVTLNTLTNRCENQRLLLLTVNWWWLAREKLQSGPVHLQYVFETVKRIPCEPASKHAHKRKTHSENTIILFSILFSYLDCMCEIWRRKGLQMLLRACVCVC